MAVKIKFAGPAAGQAVLGRKLLLLAGLAVVAVSLVFIGVFGFYYLKYKHIVDERLEKPLFTATAKIYAAPAELRPGQKFTVDYIAQQLRNAGYSSDGDRKNAPIGTFTAGPESITVHPGPESYHAPEGATITFDPALFSTPSTITLTLGQLELSNTAAPITIQGPGAGLLAIDGGGSTRIFEVDAMVEASISGLTIQNAGTSSTQGSGVDNHGTVSIDHSTLAGNQAISPDMVRTFARAARQRIRLDNAKPAIRDLDVGAWPLECYLIRPGAD